MDIGDICTTHEACGNGAMCVFSGTSKSENSQGRCYGFNSVDEESSTILLSHIDGEYHYQQYVEKVCASGWINLNTGKCQAGLLSERKVGDMTVG